MARGAGPGRQWALINAIWRPVCVSDHGYCHRQSDREDRANVPHVHPTLHSSRRPDCMGWPQRPCCLITLAAFNAKSIKQLSGVCLSVLSWFLAWAMTIARWELKIKVIGQDQGLCLARMITWSACPQSSIEGSFSSTTPVFTFSYWKSLFHQNDIISTYKTEKVKMTAKWRKLLIS